MTNFEQQNECPDKFLVGSDPESVNTMAQKKLDYCWRDYLKFLIPSFVGGFAFLYPIEHEGSLTIPLGIMSDYVSAAAKDILPVMLLCLVATSVILTLFFSFYKRYMGDVQRKPWVHFVLPPSWIILRVLGLVFSICIYFKVGPEIIWAEKTGHTVFFDLAIPIASIFIFASLFMPLLTDYGLMEFIGTLLRPVFKTLFKLPGRSAVDALASWMSASAVGVMITSQQQDQGYYSGREAAVIATNFSVVSLPFCLIIAKFTKMESMFIPFYLTVTMTGIVLAMIMPRLPPLSRKPDYYSKAGKQIHESVENDAHPFAQGINSALAKAKAAPTFRGWLNSVIENISDIWFGLLPPMIFIATAAMVIAEYTPIFVWLSYPLVPLLKLLQLPEATEAAPALLLSFADMFLPSVIAASIDSELTRFVLITVSVCQLVYMSEMGVLILKSNIPLNLFELIVIFLLRTLLALPIVAFVGHALF